MRVRPLALFLLGAVLLHGAARYAGGAGPVLRLAAWGTLAGGAAQSGILLRAEVLAPIAALAGLDLAVHRTQIELRATGTSTLERVIAAGASLIALGLITTLILLAADTLVLVRLGATILVAWAVIVLFTLRRETRDTLTLLAGAGAISITFLLLTAPVIPFGPLLAYWTIILTTALAVVTGAATGSRPSLEDDLAVHAQRVHPLPDPVIADTREAVRGYLATGVGARTLSHRIEAALDRDEGGRLLNNLAQARAKGAAPSRRDRALALAELLGLEALPTDLET